ncbi:MAG: diguanylate cyclase [Candidatus Methylomirabilis sp.]|nr:diguanylate cyclase [Deltaproteobacteria bacterium]
MKKIFRVIWSDCRPTLSIGTKTLLAFLLIISVLTGGFYFFVSVKFSSQAHQEAINEIDSKLRGAWSLFQSRPEQMKFGMLQAASERAVKAAVKARDSEFLGRNLIGYSEMRPYVDLWAVVDGGGRVIARRDRRAGDLLEINGAVGKALEIGGPVISTELVPREFLEREGLKIPETDEHGLMQLVVVPIIENGDVTGAFVTGTLLNGNGWLPDTVYRYFNVNASVFTITEKGAKVASAPGFQTGVFSPLTRLDHGIEGLLPEGGGFIGETELDGKGVFLGIEPIFGLDGKPIGALAVAEPISKVEAHIARMKSQILWVAAAGVLFSLLLAALTYRDTLKPVRAIRSAMDETASGNLDVALDIRTKDEFESIGQGFNVMVASIKTREDRLESFNQLSKVLLQYNDPEMLLERALSKIAELTGSEIGVIYIYDDETGILKPEVLCGISKSGLSGTEKGEGLADRCFSEQRTLALLDLRNASGPVIDAGILKFNPAGLVWLCLTYNEKPMGVLLLGSIEPYEKEMLRHMEHLVNQISIALDNAMVHKKIEKLSMTDPLTGVFNRRRFGELLKEQFKAASRYKYETGLLMMDVDNFKYINDTFGHQQGDLILSEIGRLLRENTRSTDVLARYGGEEFVCLVTHTGKEGLLALAEKIRKTVEMHRFPGLRDWQVTMSVGAALFPSDVVRCEVDLVKAADENLYFAKRNGKNQVAFEKQSEARLV